MKQKSYFFLLFLSVSFYFLLTIVPPVLAQQDQLSSPNITPYWIKRVPYTTAAGLVLSKPKSTSSQDTSFFSSKNLLTTIPSSIGGLFIAAGSLFAWLRVRRKGKTFKNYLQKIELAEQTYMQSKGKTKASIMKALKQYKEVLSNLQNEIDLSTANKKIDDEQRTTLFHALDRKLTQTV